MKIIAETAVAVILCLALTTSGCRTVPPPVAPHDIEKLPVSLSLQFSSKLPEYIVVARAPIDAHNRYRVNRQLEEQLNRLFSARSGDPSRPVTVAVDLQELRFNYDEIGGSMPAISTPLVASRTLIALKENDGGLDIPYETIKTAVVRFRVEFRDNSGEVVKTDIEKKFVESVMWDDMYANWPDDYHTFDRVIAGITTTVVDTIDDLLVKKFSRQ